MNSVPARAALAPVGAGTVTRAAGDAAAVLLLLAAAVWLQGRDGGAWSFPWQLAALGVAALPAAAVVAARLPRPGRVLLVAWGVGLVAALALAADRSDWVHPLATYSLMPVVALVAARLWERRWGPVLLAAILAAGLAGYWWQAALAWYGHLLAGSTDPRFAPLSWHNQSAALMGGLGLVFLGGALAGRRHFAVASGGLAALGLAGTWLAGSRGALLTTGLGAVVIVATTARRHRLGALGRTAGVGSVTVALVVGLMSLGTGATTAPVAARPEQVSQSLSWRVYHMEAGLAMFADRPLTGFGPGAYGRSARPYSRAEAHLTSAAHNEYVEMAAEGGLVLGAAGLATAAALAAAAASSLLRPERRRSPRAALQLGAAGALLTLLAHAGFDFDWTFPVLALLAALLAGTLLPLRPPRPPGVRMAVLAPVAAAAALALAGTLVEAGGWPFSDPDPLRVPWNTRAGLLAIADLRGAGEQEQASQLAAGVRAWNPGDRDLAAVEAVLRFESREVDGAGLAAALAASPPSFDSRNLAAAALLDAGEHGHARPILEELIATYPDRPAWRPQPFATDSWLLLVRLEGEQHGCEAAWTRARQAEADPYLGNEAGRRALAGVAEGYCR